MFADIVWAWPWALAALPLPLLMYWLAPAANAVQQRALRVPNLEPYAGMQSEQGIVGRGWLSVLLLAIMWLSLILSLSRTQAFGEPLGVPLSGRDLMLCIDISGSMRETDLYAGNTRSTRMAVVKLVARDFISRRGGDRVGLIMFGSQAYVQTPLTHDHETVQHFLDEAVVGLAGRSTAIGDAIGLGVKRLRDRPDASRVLILLQMHNGVPLACRLGHVAVNWTSVPLRKLRRLQVGSIFAHVTNRNCKPSMHRLTS